MHLHTHNSLLLWWIKPATKTSKESEWKYIMEKNKNKASECIKEKINGIHIEKCSEIWIYTTMDESRGVERERAGKNVSVVGNLCGTAHFELCMKNKMRIIHYSYSEQKKNETKFSPLFLSFIFCIGSFCFTFKYMAVCVFVCDQINYYTLAAAGQFNYYCEVWQLHSRCLSAHTYTTVLCVLCLFVWNGCGRNLFQFLRFSYSFFGFLSRLPIPTLHHHHHHLLLHFPF